MQSIAMLLLFFFFEIKPILPNNRSDPLLKPVQIKFELKFEFNLVIKFIFKNSFNKSVAIFLFFIS